MHISCVELPNTVIHEYMHPVREDPEQAERVQSAVAVLLLYISPPAGVRTHVRIRTVVGGC